MFMPKLYGENLLDEFFNDFMEFPFYGNGKPTKRMEKQLFGHKGDKLMKTDVRETDQEYILAIDLPGFKKENIQASIQDGYLTITAAKEMENEETHYLRRERFAGSMQRSFYVGEEIRQEDVKAQFKHGVLKLTLPKREPEKEVPQNKYIAIEG